MDVIFVEDSEDDVNRGQGGKDEKRHGGKRVSEGLRSSLEPTLNGGGQADLALDLLDSGHSLSEGDVGREIKCNGDGGKLSLMSDSQRRVGFLVVRKGTERDGLSRRRAHIDILERIRALLEFGIDLHHYVILIDASVNGGDLPLAKGVVERVIDGAGRDAQAPGGGTVDHQFRF